MGKIVWDGEASWNTTTSTQDAYCSLHVTQNGALEEKMRITSAGNVGIGTTSPQAKLHVQGAGQINKNSGRIDLSVIDTGIGSDNGYWEWSLNGALGANTFGLLTRTDGGTFGQEAMRFTRSGTTISSVSFLNGNVGIGTSSPGYKLEVVGSFAATTKSFVIDHPTKPDMKLRHGSLEGPENGVYVRGRLKSNKIQLPDYWTGLVDEDTITVNLTPIGKHQNLWVEDIIDNTVIVGGDNVNCFYTVFAERKDIEKLEVEIHKEKE
jgi:hypothetical protein